MTKTIRNIVIFVFVALSCGWLGLFIDKIMKPQTNEEALGMGIWFIVKTAGIKSFFLLRLNSLERRSVF